MSTFKSYLRKLLRELKELDKVTPETEENIEAKKRIRELIEDTQLDIEDN